MRELGTAIGPQKQAEIAQAAMDLFDKIRSKRAAHASEFEFEMEGDPIVVNEADMRWPTGRMRVAVTTPEARPPFEWLIEITSNIDEGDYFKHYLVLEGDVVLAQRKVLTSIDDEEAEIVLADLAIAAEHLGN